MFCFPFLVYDEEHQILRPIRVHKPSDAKASSNRHLSPSGSRDEKENQRWSSLLVDFDPSKYVDGDAVEVYDILEIEVSSSQSTDCWGSQKLA